MNKKPTPAVARRKVGDELEDEFHRQLGRLIHETARFDFFVGLQLNWLGQYSGVEVSKYLDPLRATLGTRLEQLEKLVNKAFEPAGPAALREFAEWFASAKAARALRNNYAHGRWGVPGRLAESPLGPEHPRIPQLAFIALDWDMSPERGDRSTYMTMEELSAQVSEAVTIFSAFFRLADKHLAFVRPQ